MFSQASAWAGLCSLLGLGAAQHFVGENRHIYMCIYIYIHICICTYIYGSTRQTPSGRVNFMGTWKTSEKPLPCGQCSGFSRALGHGRKGGVTCGHLGGEVREGLAQALACGVPTTSHSSRYSVLMPGRAHGACPRKLWPTLPSSGLPLRSSRGGGHHGRYREVDRRPFCKAQTAVAGTPTLWLSRRAITRVSLRSFYLVACQRPSRQPGQDGAGRGGVRFAAEVRVPIKKAKSEVTRHEGAPGPVSRDGSVSHGTLEARPSTRSTGRRCAARGVSCVPRGKDETFVTALGSPSRCAGLLLSAREALGGPAQRKAH